MCGIQDSSRSKRSPRIRTTPKTFTIGSEPIVTDVEIGCELRLHMHGCRHGSEIGCELRLHMHGCRVVERDSLSADDKNGSIHKRIVGEHVDHRQLGDQTTLKLLALMDVALKTAFTRHMHALRHRNDLSRDCLKPVHQNRAQASLVTVLCPGMWALSDIRIGRLLNTAHTSSIAKECSVVFGR